MAFPGSRCTGFCEQGNLPQQISRPQYVNNPHYRLPYPTQCSEPPRFCWLSDPYVGQDNSNGLFYSHDSYTSQSSLTCIAGRNCVQHAGGFASGSNEYMDTLGYSNTSGDMHRIEDSDLPFASPVIQLRGTDIGDNVAGGSNQLGFGATQRSSHMSIMDSTGKNCIPSGYNSNSSSPDNQVPLINQTSPSTLYNGPSDRMDPNAFRTLPGYSGHRNGHKLLDCFGDCKKGRFGKRGIDRRANFITHLRNCHGQTIPKGARV